MRAKCAQGVARRMGRVSVVGMLGALVRYIKGPRFWRQLRGVLWGVVVVGVVLGGVSQVWLVQVMGNWENERKTHGASMAVAVCGGYLVLGGDVNSVTGDIDGETPLVGAYSKRGMSADVIRDGRTAAGQIMDSPNTQSFLGLGKNMGKYGVPAVSPGANPNPPIRTTYAGMVMVHLGYVVVLAGVYPSVYAWRHRRRRPRHVCVGCGYDLRATADVEGPLVERCPECGRWNEGAGAAGK